MKRLKGWIVENDVLLICVSAALLSFVFFVYYYNLDLITAYGDSRGHLNIARRVVDSYTPGVAQLGGYWLPLLHVLMLPTVWIDWFWTNGVSGSIPNMIAYVVGAGFLYKTVKLILKDRIAALISASIYILNLNLLYFQASAMTESLFVSTLIVAFYFFYKWCEFKKISDLLLSSVFVFLCTLNRYEGWLVALFAVLLLFLSWVVSKFNSRREGVLLIYSVVALAGVIFWVLWGFVIFHDPLEFLNNELSAGNRINSEIVGVRPLGSGDILETLFAIFLSIYHMIGPLILILFILSIIAYIVIAVYSKKVLTLKFFSFFILLAPLFFDVFAVYSGKIPVEVPIFSRVPYPNDFFNVRYALYSIPAICVFLTVFLRWKILKILIFALICINYLVFSPIDPRNISSFRDAGVDKSLENPDVEWFTSHYKGGYILSSAGENDPFMFATGIHQENYITEGSYLIWEKSLVHPQDFVEWVVVSETQSRDQVLKNIDMDELLSNYKLVYYQSGRKIYKKVVR